MKFYAGNVNTTIHWTNEAMPEHSVGRIPQEHSVLKYF